MLEFDTEFFIDEVQKRPCLWDINDDNYFFRAGRKKAWEAIAAAIFPGMSSMQIADEVPELQRKWKHIRDYYVREKRKGGTSIGQGKGKRKKTLEKLQFLNSTEERFSFKKKWKKMAAESYAKRHNILISDTEDGGSMSEDQRILPEVIDLHSVEAVIKVEEADTVGANKGSKPSTAADWPMLPPHLEEASNPSMAEPMDEENYAADVSAEYERQHFLNVVQQQQEDDSDRQFLLSLLPQMRCMNERQNFDFRLDVMKLIKKVRYPSPGGSPRHSSNQGCANQVPVSDVWIKEEVDDLQ